MARGARCPYLRPMDRFPGVYSSGLEETSMSKSKDTKRETKKQPKLSLKEKRAAKQAKKAGK